MTARSSFPGSTRASFDVWMAAYGPKALEVAGRDADGLIMQLADPFIVHVGDRRRTGGAPRRRSRD